MHVVQLCNNVVFSDTMAVDLVVAAMLLAVVDLSHQFLPGTLLVYHALALRCDCALHVSVQQLFMLVLLLCLTDASLSCIHYIRIHFMPSQVLATPHICKGFAILLMALTVSVL